MILQFLAPLAQVDNTNLEQTGALDSLLDMSDTALYALVLAAGLPWIMAAINRATWPSTVKFALVCIACIAGSAGWLIARDEFDTGDFFRMSLLVIVGATALFKLWYRPLKEVETNVKIG